MRVGVVGYGVIGAATGSVFPDLVVYDPPKGFHDIAPLRECPVVFLCVPTPTTDGRQDLAPVRQALDDVSCVLGAGQTVAVRSTVLPGTTRALQMDYPHLALAANPEFLRSHRAKDDARRPFRIVVGADGPRARSALVDAYERSLVPDARRRLVLTDSVTAELVKYGANCYLATKISYFNEMYDICRTLGGDYETLRTALGLDPRIAPGEETIINLRSRGFDDECLPKDLDAFITFLEGRGFPVTLLQGAAAVNSALQARRPLEQVEW